MAILTFPDHLKLLCKNNCPLLHTCVFTMLNLSFYFLGPDYLCSKLLPDNYKSEASEMGFFPLLTLMDIVLEFYTLYSNSVSAPHTTAANIFVCWISPCTPWCLSSQCQGWRCGLFTSIFHAPDFVPAVPKSVTHFSTALKNPVGVRFTVVQVRMKERSQLVVG